MSFDIEKAALRFRHHTVDERNAESEELKQHLAKNAFDFLEKSIEQFDEEPKYSIINFAVAIELFLKLRLVHEHWSLIDVSPLPNFTKLKQGSARTINFRDVMPKIESVTGYKFSKEMKQCFGAIAQHRNKIIHFFHQDFDQQKEQKEQKEQILLEELQGWRHIQQLFRDWGFLFFGEEEFGVVDGVIDKEYMQKIYSIGGLMKKNAQFLENKYDSVKAEIEKEKKDGAVYKNCPVCGYDSCRVDKTDDSILGENQCKVCDVHKHFIEFKCPQEECGKTIKRIEGEFYGSMKCPKCEHSVDKNDIIGMLETRTKSQILRDKTGGGDGYADCAFCGDYGCVVDHHGLYVCANCITVTEDVYPCSHCGNQKNEPVCPVFGCSTCQANHWERIKDE